MQLKLINYFLSFLTYRFIQGTLLRTLGWMQYSNKTGVQGYMTGITVIGFD